jgi:Penicillinase repressor
MNPVITALPVGERIDMTDNVPTGRELEALKVLWTRGKATVREIYQEMKPRDGEGELAYTTVLSLLQTMEQKGLAWIPIEGKPANISTCLGSGLSENFSSCAIDLVILRQE